MIAIDLSKQQALDAHPKAIQEIDFTANLDRDGDTTIFFIIEEMKESIIDFSQGTIKVLWLYFNLIWFKYKMTQYNTLNVKLFNSQLNKLKSGIKNNAEVTLKISSNINRNSNNENNFQQKLILTNAKVSYLCKAFGNNSSANIKLSVKLSTA